MKSIEEINVNEKLSSDDFLTLFKQVELNVEEQEELKTDYYKMYELFLDSNVSPVSAWVAVRNIFIVKKSL